MLQPGTTHDFELWIQAHPGIVAMSLSGAFGGICTAAGLGLLAFACGVVGYYYSQQVENAVALANRNQQCFRVRWHQWPTFGNVMNDWRIDAYGAWETWIWRLDGTRYWGFPTSCKMWRQVPNLV